MQTRRYILAGLIATAISGGAPSTATPSPQDAAVEFRRCPSFTFGGDIRAYHVRAQNMSCRAVRSYIHFGEPSGPPFRFDCAYRVIENRIYSFRCRDADRSLKFKAV